MIEQRGALQQEIINRDNKRRQVEAFVPTSPYKVFAVVRGRDTGLFSTYEEVKTLVNGVDGVYNTFRSKELAKEWFFSSFNRPLFNNPHAMTIHVGSADYDVSQDKDLYAGKAIIFGYNDPRNIIQRVTERTGRELLSFNTFIQMLEIAPMDVPIRVYTDCKVIAFGINYGMRDYPKHELVRHTRQLDKWARIDQLLAARISPMSIDYSASQNQAHSVVIRICEDQNNGNFKRRHNEYAKKQCTTWSLCAFRIGKTVVNHDTRKLISKRIWRNRFCVENTRKIYK